MQIYTAALKLAATKLGGTEALAKHLRADATRLVQWMCGAEMPQLHFLRCVEVIVADDQQLEKFRRAVAAAATVVIDLDERRAFVGGNALALPLTEWSVLESLSARIGQVVSRAQLRRELALWSGKSLADGIHMYVFRLRLKIAPAGLTIRTIPRNGYVLEAGAEAA